MASPTGSEARQTKPELTTETPILPKSGASTRAMTELSVTGMTCSHCAQHVTDALRSVPGVDSAIVDLEQNQAVVRWSSTASPTIEAAIKAVQAAGFQARLREPASADHGHAKLAGWQLNLWIGVLGTVPLMLGEWVFGWGGQNWFQWFSFLVAGMVQVLAGARFYRGAWGQLKAGSSNMDTLVSLGSTTAFTFSAWLLLTGRPGHTFFMEAASIITIISVGHWMESRVSVRASGALRQLLQLAPPLARRLGSDGSESEIPVSALRPGDRVAIRPGDRVPTDGEVLEGGSAVDESMLTGESAPVDKAAHSLLYAGTVNINGRLQMRVTATGEGTALAHIIASVQRAQGSRADIQRLGDRVSNVFVPVVVAVAVLAGLWWGLAPEKASQIHAWLAHYLWVAHPPESPLAAALIIAASVLIIACPCAMGLATPAAIMAGSNAAAQRGILIRDGVALEKAGTITAVLLDKTGTLTAGKPQVAATLDLVVTPGNPHEPGIPPLPDLAAALARHSTHPISQAIVLLAATGIPLADWDEVAGSGVQARLQPAPGGTQTHSSNGTEAPRLARLGATRWLEANGIDLAPGLSFITEWSAQGATLVGVAVDRVLIGLVAVKDTLKPGAHEVIDRLHRQGLKLWLVTGDNSLTAASIAQQAGIPAERVFAEARPEQKAQFVQRLQAQGERVAFVGDGINDAPALEQADLGIAVSRASDVAREAADLILLRSEIEAVPEGLGLARATLRTIKQNLFWAFFYNCLGIPLAALGFMSPVLCAAAMGLSDLVVIGNALRLRRWRL